ncbi:biopolymer transporter ExbD [Thiomonas sp.]|jgi:biopolymer transport protein ExbD|uniref:ExbD/TolR family protein n=1 Tax=Thiomonas sp. TaxID=2047785 RepID=UPI002622745F|nr:biopolymer transporter ExbD [Thiomonas sp.]
MNFQRPRPEEPEINLIPLIDVLLVVLIFLMITTTYSKYTELKIQLPVADASAATSVPHSVVVGVTADGSYAVAGRPLRGRDVPALVEALRAAAQGRSDVTLVISADAQSTQQSVVNVMEAARLLGISRLTFATQRGSS